MLECSFQLPVVAKYPSKLLMRDPATNGETHRLRICVFLEIGVRGRSMAFHAPYAQQKTHHSQHLVRRLLLFGIKSEHPLCLLLLLVC